MAFEENREGRPSYDTYIKDPARVNEIKEQWKAVSPDKFHVLADFDRTLTRGNIDGKRSASVIAQIRNGGYLSDEYTAAAHALFDQYHPIEIDERISDSKRIAVMQEWWVKNFTLLGESGLTRDMIEKIAKENPMPFREGTEDLLKKLELDGIPLVILSAAPGDMVLANLKHAGLDTSNLHVLATMYDFDEAGSVQGIHEPIIHSLNKHEISIEGHPAHSEVVDRPNVLLLGDGIGDIGMIEGYEYETLLKVGFLNVNISDRKEAFMDAFDIVIAHDGPMSPVVELLDETIFS